MLLFNDVLHRAYFFFLAAFLYNAKYFNKLFSLLTGLFAPSPTIPEEPIHKKAKMFF